MPEPIYLDHAATTPVRAEVLEAMLPFYGPRFGNPSSVHRWGREARTALDEAHERRARCIGATAHHDNLTYLVTDRLPDAHVPPVERRQRSEEHTSALQSPQYLVSHPLLEH